MGWLFNRNSSVDEVDRVIEHFSNNVMDDEIYDRKALRNSDVFTAVKILAGDVAASKIKSNNPEVERLLNTQPNELMTGFSLKHVIMVNLLLYGNAYVAIIRDEVGRPVKLKFMETIGTNVYFDEENYDLIYNYTWNGENIVVRKENVLHFKMLSEDGLMGVSPLIALQREIALQNHGNKILLSFFKRGAFSSGILTILEGKLNKEAKEKIRKAWEEANNGSDNSSNTIILDSTMKYDRLELDTKVLDLVNNNVYSTKQIAKVFSIPLNRFGMELVNSNDGDMNLEYIKSTLKPYFVSIEEELNMKLGGEHKVDGSHLLEATFKEQAETLVELVETEIITKEEAYARLFEGGIEK